MEKSNRDIGALWSRSGAKGEYMTGTITIGDTAYQIVAFKNDKKTGNQPDWRIYPSKPKAKEEDDVVPEALGHNPDLEGPGIPF